MNFLFHFYLLIASALRWQSAAIGNQNSWLVSAIEYKNMMPPPETWQSTPQNSSSWMLICNMHSILVDIGRCQRTISEVWKIYMLKTVCQIYKIRGSEGSEGSKDFIYLANCLKHIYFPCWGYCTRTPAFIFYISRFIEFCTFNYVAVSFLHL